ncbi:MAG: tRNA (adenosine(37)-N6)-threonylcarbamoyltransferase complex ATPase subunit type 1 TsaE, partial [Propionibacteriaceae bacterium]|nr:tRNA (adenosine(37)-N6)-threonylcarbamoyltransferase complex ATPase subunit type 1 TsaE [Propionibacteriaceae bacterium]
MRDDSAEVELVELGPDADEVRGLGLDPVGSHWVGAFAGDRLIGAAGWSLADQSVPSPAGVDTPARLTAVLVGADWRGQGVGAALVAAAEELAADLATAALPAAATIVAEAPDDEGAEWLRGLGYAGAGRILSRRLPVLIDVPTAEAMQALGARLGRLVRAGDVVILTGDLGAGKTTLTQGIGVGLGIAEAITSPTFVLSRIHRGGAGAADLVHVDAYRLRGDEGDGAQAHHGGHRHR